jgi:hypothetical protein
MSWVPRSLTIKHKTDRKAISSEFLACFEPDGEAFLSQIVTADETWVHHSELETKRNRARNGTDKAYTHFSHWHNAVEVDGDFVEK